MAPLEFCAHCYGAQTTWWVAVFGIWETLLFQVALADEPISLFSARRLSLSLINFFIHTNGTSPRFPKIPR
jgi:hypothetical protein